MQNDEAFVSAAGLLLLLNCFAHRPKKKKLYFFLHLPKKRVSPQFSRINWEDLCNNSDVTKSKIQSKWIDFGLEWNWEISIDIQP